MEFIISLSLVVKEQLGLFQNFRILLDLWKSLLSLAKSSQHIRVLQIKALRDVVLNHFATIFISNVIYLVEDLHRNIVVNQVNK